MFLVNFLLKKTCICSAGCDELDLLTVDCCSVLVTIIITVGTVNCEKFHII